jgi:hypothetical protein
MPKLLLASVYSLVFAIAYSTSPLVEAQSGAAPGNPPIELSIYPLDIALDKQGNAYVADRNMHGVWKWNGSELSVFQQGSNKFRTPLNATRCVAVDNEGGVLIGDSATREVYRVKDGQLEPLTDGLIGIPMDLAVASDGTIYVADVELRVLYRIVPGAEKKAEVVAKVNPRGVFVDSKDNVWVVSQDPQQLQVINPAGEIEVIVGERVFEFPHQVVVNSAGEAFITDGYKKGIWRVVRGEAPELVFSGEPLDNPVGIALDDQERLVVVDPRARKVFRFDAEFKPEVWFEISQP